MNKFVILMLICFAAPFVSAKTVPQKCFRLAENAIHKLPIAATYDEDGIHTNDCNIAINDKVAICEVYAMKGDGAANDTYDVVVNNACTKVLRTELIGEE